MKNPIIAELRRVRDAIAKRHNYDLDAMARELTQLEPWMEKKTYTLHRGKMVPLISLRARKQRQAPRQRLGTKKAKNYCEHTSIPPEQSPCCQPNATRKS